MATSSWLAAAVGTSFLHPVLTLTVRALFVGCFGAAGRQLVRRGVATAAGLGAFAAAHHLVFFATKVAADWAMTNCPPSSRIRRVATFVAGS